MKNYVITYVFERNTYTIVEHPIKGYENQFLKQVLDRIVSITQSGGVIKEVCEVW
jgi:hypothetical protein